MTDTIAYMVDDDFDGKKFKDILGRPVYVKVYPKPNKDYEIIIRDKEGKDNET